MKIRELRDVLDALCAAHGERQITDDGFEITGVALPSNAEEPATLTVGAYVGDDPEYVDEDFDDFDTPVDDEDDVA